MANVVLMPAVVADAEDAVLTSWLVAEGDSVTKGQPLAEIETDKANVEVEADAPGTVGRLLAQASERVAVGAPIAVLLGAGEDASAIAAALGTSSAPMAEAVPAAATSRPQRAERIFASPLARRIAAEHGIDIATISGRGPHGRILKADVVQAIADAGHRPAPTAPVVQEVSGVQTPTPLPTSSDAGHTDVPLTGMRRAIARRLTESKSSVPHFYVTVDVRMDDLLVFRQRLNQASPVKISVNDLLVKAIASALLAVPAANAVWNGDSIRRYQGVDISVAVSNDAGLVTPVVRGVDKLGLVALASTTADLIARARDGRLKQHEIEGGSFTISNMGMYGVREFSAILNPPQSGILAVGAAEQRPVVIDGELAVATMMTMTLSADHRVIDGALGAEFMQALKLRLENPLLMAL